MKITHTTQDVEKYKGDMITYFVHQQGKKGPVCDNKFVQDSSRILSSLLLRQVIFPARKGKQCCFILPARESFRQKGYW
jgi:hypothetical protein